MGILNFFKKNSSPSQKKAENITLPQKKLSVAEIQFLQYLSNHDTNIATFKKYFSLNYEDTISLLLKNNYMQIGSAEESLSLNTVQDLKKFLKLKNLSLSGKKEDLIQRILSETTDYDTYFSKRIFILTEKGQTAVNEYEITRINNLKMEIADTISYIRNNELKKLIALYKSEPNDKNSLSLGYDKDSIIKDIQAINEYRNMSHDNDRELTICIITVMFHQTQRSNIDTLKELGYEDITESEIYTIFSSIRSLKNIAEYKELDIKEYKISTCGDVKVCNKCSKHHNKKYLVSEAVLGKTMPPFCDKCRCVMLPQFDL